MKSYRFGRFWIQFCPWVGSGFKSVEFYGFGFGFKIVHRLGQASNLCNLMDLDSILSMGRVGFQICKILWIRFFGLNSLTSNLALMMLP